MNRRRNPLVTHGRYAAEPRHNSLDRGHRVFNKWVRGASYISIATADQTSVEAVRGVIRTYVHQLWHAHNKWKLAEVKCHALAMELRLLRLGKDAEPDRPLESLNPPQRWLAPLRAAGIETVNQLRSVSEDMLLANWRFPRGAIDWACLKFEKLGLSHRLRPTNRVHKRPVRWGKKWER